MKISLTRALKEVEVLEKRIAKSIEAANLVAAMRGKKLPTGYTSVEQIQTTVKGEYQAVVALIARRNLIKREVLKANSVTPVTIGNKVMTIAEAIDLRNNGIKLDLALLAKLKQEYAQVTRAIDAENQKMEASIERMVEAALGKDKVDKNAYDTIATPYRTQHEAVLIDPLGMRTLILALQSEIEDFQLNIDFGLSEINARTEIEVD